MEKIFKAQMKFWLWHSCPLNLQKLEKFLSRAPSLHFFENGKCVLKLIFCAESKVGSSYNMEKNI